MTVPAPIVLIAPYRRLHDLALGVRSRYDRSQIAVLEGNLHQGVEAARRALSEGTRVVLSRGGTARLIAEQLGIGVVEIRISSYDVVHSIHDLVGTQEMVAAIGFADIIRGIRPICELLKIPAAYFQIEDEAELPSLMDEIEGRGFRQAIGDVVSMQTALAHGMTVHLVETGEEAVAEAMDRALAIYDGIRTQVEKNQQLETLVSAVDETVLLVEKAGVVLLSNLSALRKDGFSPSGTRLVDFGDDLVRLVRDATTRKDGPQTEATLERVVAIDGNDYFASVHRLPETDGRSPDAVVVIRSLAKMRSIDRSIRRQQRRTHQTTRYGLDDIVCADEGMKRCVTLARRYARTDSSIAVVGETGTGKELFAQGIHRFSKVAQGPFVAVNCGAIPPTLVESELFGYVDGAFTGAHRGGRAGLFEAAHRGTLFLDEINALDLSIQSRLLRVLQEKEVQRIGDTKSVPISVRVIVASNNELAEEVRVGRFRADLFYRLSVLSLRIPSLRQRRQDIGILFRHFLDASSKRAGRDVPTIDRRVLEWIDRHDWPGNVRELMNFSERYFLYATEMNDMQGDLLEDMLEIHSPSPSDMPASPIGGSAWTGSLREIERRIVLDVLAEEEGNIGRAAQRLGIDRNTVRRKMRNG